MRLNKLSKELGITAAEVVKILKKEKDLIIENSPNFKLDSEIVEWLMANHKKEKAQLVEEIDESDPIAFTEKIIAKAAAKKKEKNAKVETITNSDVPVPQGKVVAEIPELTGPKVLGKIELPTPVVKEKKTVVEGETPEPKPVRKKAKKSEQKKNRRKKEVIQPTEGEKREKEIEKTLKQREKQRKAEKERKKQAYFEKAKPIVQETTKKVKKKKNKKAVKETAKDNWSNFVTESNSVEQNTAKGPLGRFWHWLTNAD